MLDSLKRKASALKAETFALYFAARHRDTPWYAKAMAALVVAYAFSPIDLVPDFVPVLGYLDDLILIPAGIAITMRMIPDAVLVECRELARHRLEKGKPVNWVAGGIIVTIWVAAAGFAAWWSYEYFNSEKTVQSTAR